MEHNMDYRKQYDEITETVRKCFDMRRHNLYRTYSNSVLLSGKRNMTSIYIRYEVTTHGLTVNFSNVDIDDAYKRKGVFTHLVNEVAKLECVKALKIGSVLTDEMRSWCIKNQFWTKDGSDYYRVIRK